ncbi:hypothetical protein [Dorea sp. D27]|uniref:hypothetical protein n=1 Tax=Dorea sp. D27 TaxID=658665 RepID=UPI0006735885|nr:hypothetical protein [Dorea sp. D27]KMZ55132.1 hypothetical protein HMPREF0980_00810 [Dorea sp. D27]
MDKKKRYFKLFLFTLFFTGLLFALKQAGQQDAADLDRSSYTHDAITERGHIIDMPRSEQAKAGIKESGLEKTSPAPLKLRKGSGFFLLFGISICLPMAAFRGRFRSSLISFLIFCIALADVHLCHIRLIHERDGKKRAVSAR